MLTPTGYNYVKDMSDDLEGYLHIAEPYYSETSGSVGTATSDEFIEILCLVCHGIGVLSFSWL